MPSASSSPERVLERLDWTVVRRLDGLLQGEYRTLFHGHGLDLAELREYQLTDDVRYIDWNVTARLQEPYVRQYREDRDITAWFLLDLSPSVDFGTVRALKRTVLVDFVAVLARLLTRRGNQVGAVTYSGGVDAVVPPGGGKRQVLRLIRAIENSPRPKRTPPTDLRVLLEKGLHVVRRRSLVFLVSDFMSAPGWEGSVALLAQRHEVQAVRLYDPREVEMPPLGLVLVEDAESGEQMLVDTNDKAFRRRFAEAGRRRYAALQAALARTGVPLLELSTEDDLTTAIIRYASVRKHTRHHAVRNQGTSQPLPQTGAPAPGSTLRRKAPLFYGAGGSA
jgi:uncharacterized protein (DUF58 family)